MNQDLAALDRTIATLATRLIEQRARGGYWTGHLASSALSTATATVALMLHERDSDRDASALVRAGLHWLAAHQNNDGGWGDTVQSVSNVSTTLLCWAALSLGKSPVVSGFPPSLGFGVARRSATRGGGSRTSQVTESVGGNAADQQTQAAIERAEGWLRTQIGDLSGHSLKNAIMARYGKDRTFSVPILMVLALTGRLGSGVEGWKLVPQLPFELSACPHRWFQWLRLPVVSYALPALVAIGQVRHHHAPTRNPLLAPIRSALRSRTLGIARGMQPESGGYLEATPLTAFVVMSLIGSGNRSDPIVERGIRFLIASARADGSWPIDSNLATWVTTLSVDALRPGGHLSSDDQDRILKWLLDQQVRQEHPFTHAKPGGWAWTDLTGGVPDADDTAGALLAIWNLAGLTASAPASASLDEALARSRAVRQLVDRAILGIDWLLDLQNRDGGIPTFCRGWGALPFDRSAPDLTAHTLAAWNTWHPAMPQATQNRMSRAARRATSYLAMSQQADGSWLPLWFGNQHALDDANSTYGTSRVVASLAVVSQRWDSVAARNCVRRGVTWLLNAQNGDGGWGGAAGTPSTIEETGVALHALAVILGGDQDDWPLASSELERAVSRAVRWLIAATGEGSRTPASPIGLYFARLWYSEELYPLVFGLQGLSQARAVIRLTPL